MKPAMSRRRLRLACGGLDIPDFTCSRLVKASDSRLLFKQNGKIQFGKTDLPCTETRKD